MSCFSRIEWKRDNQNGQPLFHEIHHLALTGPEENGVLFHCYDSFESAWYKPYETDSFRLPYIFYSLITEGAYRSVGPDWTLELKRGDFLISRLTGTFRSQVTLEPMKRRALVVSATPFHMACAAELFPDDVTVIRFEHPEKIEGMMREIQQAVAEDHDHKWISCRIFALIQELAGHRRKPNRPETLQRALAAIAANRSGTLRTEELAAACHVSSKTLTRLFVKHFGLPPGRYLARRRLEKARNLLSMPGPGIQEIAEECGFGSANFFARSFRAVYGVSPTEFRRDRNDC